MDLCEGNPLGAAGFPTQRPVMRKQFPLHDFIVWHPVIVAKSQYCSDFGSAYAFQEKNEQKYINIVQASKINWNALYMLWQYSDTNIWVAYNVGRTFIDTPWWCFCTIAYVASTYFISLCAVNVLPNIRIVLHFLYLLAKIYNAIMRKILLKNIVCNVLSVDRNNFV